MAILSLSDDHGYQPHSPSTLNYFPFFFVNTKNTWRWSDFHAWSWSYIPWKIPSFVPHKKQQNKKTTPGDIKHQVLFANDAFKNDLTSCEKYLGFVTNKMQVDGPTSFKKMTPCFGRRWRSPEIIRLPQKSLKMSKHTGTWALQLVITSPPSLHPLPDVKVYW